MSRFTGTAAIITILILMLVFWPVGVGAESVLNYESWVQHFSGPDYNQVFALDTEPLRLPDSGFREFSEEGQDKLFDLASRFGEEQLEEEEFREISRNSLLTGSLSADFSLTDSTDSSDSSEDLAAASSLSDRLQLSADHREILYGEQQESKTEVSLEFDLGRWATLRAGYGEQELRLSQLNVDSAAEAPGDNPEISEEGFSVLSTRDFSEVEDVSGDRDFSGESDFSGERDFSGVSEERKESEEGEDREERAEQQLDTGIINRNLQQNDAVRAHSAPSLTTNPGQVGITIRPFDNLSFSADYRQEDIFSSSSRDYAILGLEYRDSLGNLRASYQFDSFSENRQSISGLELDFLDLATLSASYKLLDLDELENRLQAEWDLGLDLNVSDFSSLSLGYQLIDSYSDQETEDSENQESSISASFEIRF